MASLRDLGLLSAAGTAAYNLLKKPDGSAIQSSPVSSFISQGLASRTTGLLQAKALDPIRGGISSILEKSGVVSTKSGKGLRNIVPNPLELYASYAPMWTFACLEKSQFNNPQTYRNSPKDLKHVVFASGGRFDKQRTQTAHGAPEYFVNNFVMQTAIAANSKSGNSNAFKFSWDIIEPHSMGLLLQSLQMAAINAGYANYLNNAPFVLRLDFMGSNEEGQILTSIKPKFFTVTLTKVTFTVNENGSVYKCEAVPCNHKGFSDSVNVAYTAVKLACSKSGEGAGTVKDLLTTGENSLSKYLNNIEEDLLKDGKVGVRDIYEIQFPEKSDDFVNNASIPNVKRSATADPNAKDILSIIGKTTTVSTEFGQNEIGGADFGFDQKSGGNYPFKKHGDQVDAKTGVVKRDQMTVDPKTRAFQFSQKQSLTAIINQVILSSTYSKKALDPKNLTPEGMIKWWRLDVQIQLLDYDPLVGDYARKVIYRVVPFLVHHSIFSPPTAAPVGYQQLEKQIVKQYNYIYTGQNTDVLKFDIEINNLFFTGTNPSAESTSAKVSNQDQKGIGEDKAKQVSNQEGAAPAAQLANLGRARVKRDPALMTKSKGGSGDKTSEQQVAESFHKAFTSAGSGDLVKVNLEIIGDPYWMVDSGISNYFARPSTKSSLITEDGTMNYEGGDVYVYLTFRTPSDIDETTGLYQFPTAGKESPFSGIYRVTLCENTFSDGIFKQKLTCIRQVGQSQDYGGSNPNEISKLAIDKLTSMISNIGKEEPAKTSPVEDTSNKA